MTCSNIIELAGVIASTITSIIAIGISVRTLKQNSKMIEGTTRPNIGIYGTSTYIVDRHYYIILKNFGQSRAVINSFTYSFDIDKLSLSDTQKPFSKIEGAVINPGQSYRAAIDFDKVTEYSLESINFGIKYSSGTNTYEDDICLKIDANLGNLEAHNTPEKSHTTLGVISETLQDMHIKSL